MPFECYISFNGMLNAELEHVYTGSRTYRICNRMLVLMLRATGKSSTILTVLPTVQLNVSGLRLRGGGSLLILFCSSLAQFGSFALGVFGHAPRLETACRRNVQRLLMLSIFWRGTAKDGAKRV